MASTLDAFLCALAGTLVWTCVGLAVARRVVPERSLAWPMAPALGWAVQSAATMPIFFLIGFSRTNVFALVALELGASVAALLLPQNPRGTNEARPQVGVWAFVGAALLALGPAAAILPKFVGDGVILGGPIFDHSKITLIDEMTRLGLPPGNPVLGEADVPSRLAYYYLWHFGAAELAQLTGGGGWAADAAMTWFSAFASLTLMMGLATRFGGRASAALWVLPLGLAGSLRPVLQWLFSAEKLYAVILPPTGFAGWLFQAAWAPQHLMSASCVVLAIFLMSQMTSDRRLPVIATLVLAVVAGYESSAWVGGVTFAAAAAIVGITLLIGAKPAERWPFLLWSAVAVVLALALAFPLLHDQYVATAMRGEGPLIALEPMGTFEDIFTDDGFQIQDLPAFWLILMVVEFPAIYATGTIALGRLIASRSPDAWIRRTAVAFAALLVASLMVAWLLGSTIGENDDLGWRAVLPAILVLTIFSATGLSRWLAAPRPLAAAAALCAIALAMPDGFWLVYQFAVGRGSSSAPAFAETPAMWDAVRRHSGPADRIGNNPLFLRDMTAWPVNISWALLSNRRSCYAGSELAVAFAPLPDSRREETDAQFVRVFAGDGSAQDVGELATRYRCRLIVLTAQDGAWARDPFATSPYYRLVDAEAGRWKIYQVTEQAADDAQTGGQR